VEELYDIMYIPRETFIVHLLEQDLEFRRKGQALRSGPRGAKAYVRNTSAYEGRRKERANRAYELVQNSGYPSYQESIHLVEDGNIAQLPELMAEGVHRHMTYMVICLSVCRGKW
jgi:hypothetical protein